MQTATESNALNMTKVRQYMYKIISSDTIVVSNVIE